jgi:hypothetical protein
VTIVLLLTFWKLSIGLFFIQRQRFGDWNLPPPSGKNLLTLAQTLSLETGTSSIDWVELNRFLPEDGTKRKTNSVVLIRKRTIPTERPPYVGEVSANFCG